MLSPHLPPRSEVTRLLEAWGYRLAWREASRDREEGWVEVLLSREHERWIGRGLDRDEAFDDALRQALPSHAAQLGLLAATVRGPQARAALARPDPLAARADPGWKGPALVREGPTAVAILPADEASALMEELSERVDASAEELSLETPRRQRLQILEWCSRVRQVEGDAGGDPSVENRGSRVIRKLRALSSRWWPGNVIALRQSSLPSDCRFEIPALKGRRVLAWGEVAEAAAAELDRLMETGEHGWADEECLVPPHPDPEGRLRALVKSLEEVSGPLDQGPRLAAGIDLDRPGSERIASFAEWGGHARWLRGSVEDAWAWGAVVGRLRWLADSLPREGTRELARALEPSWKPDETWAERFEFDPEKRAHQELRKQHLRAAPRPEGHATSQELIDWILRACELKVAAPRIALEVEPVREAVLSIDENQKIALGRRDKKRLRRVQDILRGEVGEPAEEGDEPAEERNGAELVPPATPVERLLPGILQRTRGRSALFVSNRADNELDRELERTFEFQALDHLDGSQQGKIQSYSERVAQKRYDVVLSATGFQSHSIESKLKKAARESGTLYVSVNRGRRTACIRALARELGLARAPKVPDQ